MRTVDTGRAAACALERRQRDLQPILREDPCPFLEHVRLCLKHFSAAHSVRPLPTQSPACRGLVTFKFAGSGQARSRLGGIIYSTSTSLRSCHSPQKFDQFIGHKAGFPQLQSCFWNMSFGLTVKSGSIGPINPRLPKARHRAAKAAAWAGVF